MKRLLSILIAVVVAVVTGIGSAWLAVGEGFLFRTMQVGEWTAWPEGGSNNPDPYARALVARTAQLPLGSSEGLAFFAARDRDGEPISGTCDYALIGETPEARLWTLSVIDAEGAVVRHRSGRMFLTSREILRRPAGTFELTLSAQARPGNWMPLPETGALTVVFRVYDTIASTPAGRADLVMPSIARRACR